MEVIATVVGMIGVCLVLLAYGLISSGRLSGRDARYQLINIVGTAGILVSLSVQWNLPSFVANVAWLLIGLVGLVRILRQRRSS